MSKGRSLELFFVDGQPDGMLTAEVFNWTGHVLRVPRTQLALGLKRPEASQTGVYILIGTDEQGDLAYIGEAENMAQRLTQHAKSKDWWDQAVLVTTAGDALHKAHVKYLESRLVEIAKSAAQIELENGNIPARSSLNEAAQSNMESFLNTLQMVLPAIRVDLLSTSRRPAQPSDPVPDTFGDIVFELKLTKRKIDALAAFESGKLVVKAGSRVTDEWIGDPKHNSGYQKKYSDLVKKGIIECIGSNTQFTEDYAFNSPSAAAAIALGRAANGRTEWKLPNGKTYAEWEEDQLAKELGTH